MKLSMKIILPICLILLGLAGWSYFNSSEPKMKRKPPKKQTMIVKTISLKPGDYQSSIHAMGIVIPNREVVLKSKLMGEVVSISPDFLKGAVMEKGEMLLQLDTSDYKIGVQKAQSALDKAISGLAIEKGSQFIAKEELKLINEVSEEEIKATDLALRKPQLMQANALVQSARADLEKAKLNLARTKVFIPFNSLILEKHVNVGSLVNTQGSLAALVDVDTYQVEAQVPLDRLGAIVINKSSPCKAIIHSNYSHHSWQGEVVRTTGKVADKSRMAGVIILVSDPLNLKKQNNNPQLLLGDHVDIQIFGKTIKNVFSIPRSILRDDNTVWVYNAGVLEIKKISLAWKQGKTVYINSGINPGDKVITSDIPVAVNGMTLQLAAGDGS